LILVSGSRNVSAKDENTLENEKGEKNANFTNQDRYGRCHGRGNGMGKGVPPTDREKRAATALAHHTTWRDEHTPIFDLQLNGFSSQPDARIGFPR